MPLPEGAGKKFTETKKYTDGTKTAVIPGGFTVSGIRKETTIDEGLVIYLIPDDELENVKWDGTGTRYDGSDSNNIGLKLSTLQKEYNNAVKKVIQSGGFWVGKYETSGIDSSNDDTAVKTGNVETDCYKNIYDLCGNLNEWTTEADSTNIRVIRGGDYFLSNSASYRTYNLPTLSLNNLIRYQSHTLRNAVSLQAIN